MTKEEKATHAERKLIKAGLQFHNSVLRFHQQVREFRTSGLWACTKENHRTFAAWCAYAAPKMKLAKATLQSYGGKNYIMDKSRLKQAAIGSFWVYGEAAIYLKQAIRRAVALGMCGKVRRGTRRMSVRIAVTEIAKFFLEHAQTSYKNHKRAYSVPFEIIPQKREYKRRVA